MAKVSVTWNNWPSRRATEISCKGRPRIGSAKDRQAWEKASTDLSGGDETGFEMHFGDTAVIAIEEAQQHLAQEAPGLFVDAAGDAEIDGDQLTVGPHEQIAGMHVGVKEAVAEHHIEKGVRRLLDDGEQIMPGRFQGVDLVDGNSMDPFQRQHPPGRPLPVDGGDGEGRIVGEILGDLGRRRRLEAQVHFHGHRLFEGPDRIDEAQAAHRGNQTLDPLGQPIEEGDVPVELRLDAGPQHFDRHLFAAAGHRQMHLGDGGRRHRDIVEKLIQRLNRLPEFGGDDGAGLGRREGRQTVLQLGEIGSHLVADHVGTGSTALGRI